MPLNDNSETAPSRRLERPEYGLIALIAILYVVLAGRYNAYDIDSSWFPSFSWSFWVEHLPTDVFMQASFPDGMGGVVAFGKLAAITQGLLLNLFGWSLSVATLVSSAFVLLALLLIASACRTLGYTKNFVFCLIALMGFSEPFVAAGQRARYEFLPLFLLALALWVGARKQIVLSIFIATLATEVEPAAIVIAFAIAVFLLASNAQSKGFAHRNSLSASCLERQRRQRPISCFIRTSSHSFDPHLGRPSLKVSRCLAASSPPTTSFTHVICQSLLSSWPPWPTAFVPAGTSSSNGPPSVPGSS